LSLSPSSVPEEFKVTKVRALMTLKQSRDLKVSQAGSDIRTGRKWSAPNSLDAAESQILDKKIVGTTSVGPQGLGYNKTRKSSERYKILQKVGNEEENKRRAHAAT
jgi:hypothetical protein